MPGFSVQNSVGKKITNLCVREGKRKRKFNNIKLFQKLSFCHILFRFILSTKVLTAKMTTSCFTVSGGESFCYVVCYGRFVVVQ